MEISSDITKIVLEIHSLLLARSETLSTAESLTGGGLSSAFTDPSGASHVFIGGITAYRSEVKVKELGISHLLIEKHGVVSSQVAEAMAQGALKIFGSTWAISTTGVAGPGPSNGISAGTVWIAIAGPVSHSFELSLAGKREDVRNATIASAISAFARILRDRNAR
jgi:nicotinamide-nucleotide amidase